MSAQVCETLTSKVPIAALKTIDLLPSRDPGQSRSQTFGRTSRDRTFVDASEAPLQCGMILKFEA